MPSISQDPYCLVDAEDILPAGRCSEQLEDDAYQVLRHWEKSFRKDSNGFSGDEGSLIKAVAECLLVDVRALGEEREASTSARDIGRDSTSGAMVEEAERAKSVTGRRALPRKILRVVPVKLSDVPVARRPNGTVAGCTTHNSAVYLGKKPGAKQGTG
ncbi:hypothetical protein FIBSPDRAFT_931628 [Athelia psychrophila]|uniref:Uncharacterized protein n=1 Tax=Athelia psychrophila TaxID=1759441 RepID=A0A166K827_9AGAM|nr:hypothetical protein FIBSPDRAFT_931628 [Fibularhizoctonia sp. CBS 109695]